MKFKFKGHIGKSAFFPLPSFVLRLFVYIDCWNFYGNKHNYYYIIITSEGNADLSRQVPETSTWCNLPGQNKNNRSA